MYVRIRSIHAACAANIVLALLSVLPVGVATTTAAVRCQADAQAAIWAAASGDTVLVPPLSMATIERSARWPQSAGAGSKPATPRPVFRYLV
jgi:hypothetical protein